MIRSFRHSGLEKFFNTGSKSGIQPAHEKKLRLQLTTLNSAVTIGDIAKFEAWSLHALKGEMARKWAISVNGNWRIVFEFDGTDVCDVPPGFSTSRNWSSLVIYRGSEG